MTRTANAASSNLWIFREYFIMIDCSFHIWWSQLMASTGSILTAEMWQLCGRWILLQSDDLKDGKVYLIQAIERFLKMNALRSSRFRRNAISISWSYGSAYGSCQWRTGVTDRVVFGVEEEAILYEEGREMVFEVAAEFGRDGFGWDWIHLEVIPQKFRVAVLRDLIHHNKHLLPAFCFSK